MIQKLRRKFIIIIMSILFVVFALILGTINFITTKSGELQNKNMMSVLADHDGTMPMIGNPAMPFNFDNPNLNAPDYQNPFNYNSSFSVKLDSNNDIIDILSSNSSVKDEVNLDDIIHSVLKKNNSYGKLSSFHYLVKETSYGKIIILMDDSMEANMSQRLLFTTFIIGGISLVVLFFVSLFLSRLIVKPVEESFNKQKQFISDASHELKTPLSVISVNADVLENEIGSNKWLSYIKSETTRMSGLVNQLLSIARMDDTKRPLNITDFNLSEAVYQILLPFESTAYEQQKEYTYDIEEALQYTGELESIKQMAAILIDNAIKHTEKNGKIHVTLKRHTSRYYFEVFNTGKGIDPSEKEKIFERFYCSDYSRSRESGGYGLGLSIAKSIVEVHHGKISVQSKTGEWARFTVVL
ncbi:MAG TPA: HAMP domain-containing sensor histidine kinase [Mobilitalea sp.]|nr:HAMP domain-containing sensor histidine kinase [Mobilitalea sp.]